MAAAGGAVAGGMWAYGESDTAEKEALFKRTDQGAEDRYASMYNTGTGMLVGAGVLAATGVGLLVWNLLGDSRPEVYRPPEPEPEPEPEPARRDEQPAEDEPGAAPPAEEPGSADEDDGGDGDGWD